jgi:hypothetical protein
MQCSSSRFTTIEYVLRGCFGERKNKQHAG